MRHLFARGRKLRKPLSGSARRAESAELTKPATCDFRAAPNPAIQDPNKAATLTQLNSAVLDSLGALAIYLRSLKKVV